MMTVGTSRPVGARIVPPGIRGRRCRQPIMRFFSGLIPALKYETLPNVSCCIFQSEAERLPAHKRLRRHPGFHALCGVPGGFS